MTLETDALKILVCCHKPCALPPLRGVLLPIHVGRALSPYRLPMQGDDEVFGEECDNISRKNESYCELTALYWAWKNLRAVAPGVRYVGLFHYRRFFAFDRRRLSTDVILRPEREAADYDFDAGAVLDVLKRGNIIVGRRAVFPYSLKLQYAEGHVSDDYRTLWRAVRETAPEYFDAFIRVMEYNNKISFFNMFVMPYDDFVEYCEWLFPLLSVVEREVPWQSYGPYQRRVFGFMGERLLNVYLEKRKKRRKYFNIYIYQGTEGDRVGRALDLARCVKLRMGFVLRGFLGRPVLWKR